MCKQKHCRVSSEKQVVCDMFVRKVSPATCLSIRFTPDVFYKGFDDAIFRSKVFLLAKDFI